MQNRGIIRETDAPAGRLAHAQAPKNCLRINRLRLHLPAAPGDCARTPSPDRAAAVYNRSPLPTPTPSCSANSGCCSRKRARSCSRCCSSSRRCVPTSCRGFRGAGQRRAAAAGERAGARVASGAGERPSRSPRPRRKRCRRWSTSTRARRCAARNPMPDDALLRRYFPDLAERLPPQRVTSLGSGVIVASDGYVLTNNHVVDGRGRHPARALRRPPHRRETARHRSGNRPGGAEDRRRPGCRRSRWARSTACRSATRCSRSAIRSASATR